MPKFGFGATQRPLDNFADISPMYEELNNTLPASSVPLFRPDLAYPDLTVEMIGRLRAYGTVETVPDKTTLFMRDERQVDMFVIIEGSIEVYTRAEQNHECFLQFAHPTTVLRRAGSV